MEHGIYLLLDSKGMAVARGRIHGKTDGPFWQIQVEDGKIDDVLEHKTLKLLSMMDAEPSYEGTIVRSRNDMVQMEVAKLERSDGDMRRNLRVPVRFTSLIYPVSGAWRGRREVESVNLSCGGVAFVIQRALHVGEQVELVVPVTAEPLVVRCQLLRMQPAAGARILYAAKFVDLCNDEETLLREAVFNLQLRGRPKRPPADPA